MNNQNENELKEFISESSISMPRELKDKILSTVHSKLNPSFSEVFFKASIIQAVVGFVLILLCPQLGVGFSHTSYLIEFFMMFGHNACTFLCGSLFFSLGVIGNLFILEKEELQLFYKKSLNFQFLILGLSLSILLLLGAKGQYFIFMLWASGGLISSLGLISVIIKPISSKY